MTENIEKLRKELDTYIKKDVPLQELIKLSQKLDMEIIKYYADKDKKQ